VGTKTLQQQNPPVLYRVRQQTLVDLHNGCKMLFSPQKRGSTFLPALACVSVCDHGNYKDCGWICTKFYGKVPRGRGKTKFMLCYNRYRDVEVTAKKLRKPAIVYILYFKIVCVASVAKCWQQYPQISLSRGVLLSLRVLFI